MEQLELFHDSPFSLRLKVAEAIEIFWNNYWSHLPSAKTTKANRLRICTFFADFYLDTVSKADVERYRRHYKAMGYKDSTVNHDHMILSRLYRKFAEYKEGKFVNGEDFSRVVLPSKNPAALVPKVNVEQFARKVRIMPHHKKLLCSYADQDLCEIIDTLWWSQLRPSDLFKISDGNVNLAEKKITGIQSKTVRSRNPSGIPYMVPIPADRMSMIRRRLSDTKPGTAIFRRMNMQKRWQNTRRLAALHAPEILKMQLRDFRGAATSFLLDNRTDIETVRKKAGWKDYKMIPRYDKRADESVVEATEKLAGV